MNDLLLFARLARPDQLLAVALVYALGAAIAAADGAFDPARWLVGLLPLLLVSASVHFANEYADVETDALTRRTLFSGGSGALKEFGAPPRLAWRAAWLTLGTGVAAAALLAIAGALPPAGLLLLALGALGGWLYSVGPVALAWRGWGEVTNAVLGGLLLPAYGYALQAGRVTAHLILLSLPFALHVFVNLLATTWPDRAADRAVGKRTLATRWPLARLRALYAATLIAAYILLVWQRGWLQPDTVFWPTLSVLPLALWAAARYGRQHSPLPSVAAMIVFALAQVAGWTWLAMSTAA